MLWWLIAGVRALGGHPTPWRLNVSGPVAWAAALTLIGSVIVFTVLRNLYTGTTLGAWLAP